MTTTEHQAPPLHAAREVHWETTGDAQYVRLELSEDTLAGILYGLASTLRAYPRTAALFAAQIAGTRTLHDSHGAHIRRDIARYMAATGEDHLRLDAEDADQLRFELADVLDDIDAPAPCRDALCAHYAQPGQEWCDAHMERAS